MHLKPRKSSQLAWSVFLANRLSYSICADPLRLFVKNNLVNTITCNCLMTMSCCTRPRWDDEKALIVLLVINTRGGKFVFCVTWDIMLTVALISGRESEKQDSGYCKFLNFAKVAFWGKPQKFSRTGIDVLGNFHIFSLKVLRRQNWGCGNFQVYGQTFFCQYVLYRVALRIWR